jgi:hypothetical protein
MDCPPRELRVTLSGIGNGNATSPPCAHASCTDCASLNGTYLLQLQPGGLTTCLWQYSIASPVCGYFQIQAMFSPIGQLWLQIAANTGGSGWTLQWSKNMTWPVAHCQTVSIAPNDWDAFSANDIQWCGWPIVRYDNQCHWNAAQVTLAAV